jgi:hypothetical protein
MSLMSLMSLMSQVAVSGELIATLREALNSMAREAAEAKTCAVEQWVAEGAAAAAAGSGGANKADDAAGACLLNVWQSWMAQRRFCEPWQSACLCVSSALMETSRLTPTVHGHPEGPLAI